MAQFIYPLPHQCSEIIIKNIDSFSTLRSFMTALAILDPLKFNELKDIIQRCIFKMNPFIREIIEINNNIDTILTRICYMKYINRLYNIAIACDHDYNIILEARQFAEQCVNSHNTKFKNTKFKNIMRTICYNPYKLKQNIYNSNGFNIHSIIIPFNYTFH
jgi:hypothetical protein